MCVYVCVSMCRCTYVFILIFVNTRHTICKLYNAILCEVVCSGIRSAVRILTISSLWDIEGKLSGHIYSISIDFLTANIRVVNIFTCICLRTCMIITFPVWIYLLKSLKQQIVPKQNKLYYSKLNVWSKYWFGWVE